MKAILGPIRRWLGPVAFVVLAALLTAPWSFWVIAAAYDRDQSEKSAALAERVKIQLSSSWWWNSPQQVMNLMGGELMGDPAVQAVTFLYVRAGNPPKTDAYGYVRRSDSIPIPRSMEDIYSLLNADPDSYRKYYTWQVKENLRGVIYLDLSRPALRARFKEAYWPLLRNVMTLTAAGIVVLSSIGIWVYHRWGQEARQRQRVELQQQGMLAERGLTAAVLAHEIRNPLAALRFQLHSLRRHADDPANVVTAVDTIDAELIRIQTLLQEYLAHEKAQALRAMPVELSAAVRDLQTIMSELLCQTDTRLQVEALPGSVVVACDPHGLRQVLMNLVLNAQQAMGRGGTITIRIGQDGQFGLLSVSDTGPGIPEEMKDRLFKPFATSKKEGSGIGLALVKRFADNFGGSVAAESEPGRGATFHLRLPRFLPDRMRSPESTRDAAVQEAIT